MERASSVQFSRSKAVILFSYLFKKKTNFLLFRKIKHPSMFHFRGPQKACDMSLRDVQTIHVSSLLARDSVILVVSASQIYRIYCLQVHMYIIEG